MSLSIRSMCSRSAPMLLALCFALHSAPAIAKTPPAEVASLLERLPKDVGALAGFDSSRARGTAAMKEGLRMARKDARAARVLRMLERDFGFDLARHLDYVVAATPKFAGRPKASAPFSMVLKGTFDAEKIDALLQDASRAKPETIGGKKVHYVKRASVRARLVDPSTLVLVRGPSSWQKQAWKAALSKPSKRAKGPMADPLVSRLIGSVDTTQHAWGVADTSALDQGSAPRTREVVSSLNFSRGVSMTTVMLMASAADASTVLRKLEENRLYGAMLAAAYAAQPLVTNLVARAASSTLTLTTSMTENELRAMGRRLREIEAERRRIKAAKQADTERDGATPKAPKPSSE
ncbi:MAG: hypothetical protein AAGI01_15315 [Myxococcota bacterium]